MKKIEQLLHSRGALCCGDIVKCLDRFGVGKKGKVVGTPITTAKRRV